MKILFAGPTLYGVVKPNTCVTGTDIVCRPPAQQGDIACAVLDGASMIGLVDGRYEDVAAPWHKEILFALAKGVRVYGAASMGALRAAECAPYGMVPVGSIAARYLSGDLADDAAVAQIHGPVEMDCMPLSEALVNVEATIEACVAKGVVQTTAADRLKASATRMFFKDRTFERLVILAGFGGRKADKLINILQNHRRDIKKEDAMMLINLMRSADIDWAFRAPTAWTKFISTLAFRLPFSEHNQGTGGASWDRKSVGML